MKLRPSRINLYTLFCLYMGLPFGLATCTASVTREHVEIPEKVVGTGLRDIDPKCFEPGVDLYNCLQYRGPQ